MSTALHRTTKQLIRSANTPDHPPAQWIINPNLSAVAGWASRYWVITGDTVTLADEATRNQIDADLLTAARDDVVTQLDRQEDILRALMLVLIDEFNILRAQFNTTTGEVPQLTNTTFNPRTHAQLRTAIRNKLGT